LQYVLAFIASAAVVVVAGTILTRSADAIAEATGLGRAWIGSILLATATSLPELATDITAVRMHAANLAVGDLFGSSLANMLILAVLDQFARGGKVLRGAALENALIACLAITLNALGALFVLTPSNWSPFGISPQSLLLLLVYVFGTRAVYRNGIRHTVAAAKSETGRKKAGARNLRGPSAWFIGASAAIVLAAPALAWSAKHIAALTGLGDTFVGTWLLGLATSLPEFVTAFAAVRIGQFDLAVGNLFGSNSFNMIIFVALDLATPAGSIFQGLSPIHAISATLAVILMSLGLASIMYRAERRFLMVEPDSALMLAVYVLAIWILYAHSGG
jgi:cation:H+ antiporter